MSLTYFSSSPNLGTENSVIKKKITQLIKYINDWRCSELHCISFYRGFLFYQGLLPKKTSLPEHKLANLYRKWIPQLMTLIGYYNITFGVPFFIYTTWGIDPRLTLEAVGGAFSSVMIFSHYVTLVYRRECIENVFKSLEEMRKYGKLLPRQDNAIEERTRKLSEWTLVLLASVFLAMASFLALIPNALAKRELVYYAWYPFDEKKSPLYEIVFVSTIIIFAFGATNTVCNFILLLVLVLEADGQLKLLSHNLKNIFSLNSPKKSAKNTVNHIVFQLNSNDSKKNTTNYQNNKPSTGVSSKYQENINVSACVLHHQHIVRFVGDIETAYSLVFITLIGSILLATGLGVKLGLHSETADKAAVMGIGLVLLINGCMAVLCWLTDAVAEEVPSTEKAQKMLTK